MLAAAGEQYDVLVVGYVSRFARDCTHGASTLGTTYTPPAPRSCSSTSGSSRATRTAGSSAGIARRRGRVVQPPSSVSGLPRATRRSAGGSAIPGGNRPPLGTTRRGRELEVDAASLEVVQRTYGLAATGATDRDVALQIGLRRKHVAEILTNPFYRGELRTGEPSARRRPRRRRRVGARPGAAIALLEAAPRILEPAPLRPRRDPRVRRVRPPPHRPLRADAAHVDACEAFTARSRSPGRRTWSRNARSPGQAARATPPSCTRPRSAPRSSTWRSGTMAQGRRRSSRDVARARRPCRRRARRGPDCA
jgi:hypothetical protein